jgi:hypothetical protein
MESLYTSCIVAEEKHSEANMKAMQLNFILALKHLCLLKKNKSLQIF